MAGSDTDTENRTDLKRWVVAYRTVGDVLYSLGEIAKGRKIEDEEQLANLQRAVDTLLGDKSKDVSKNAKELLGVLSGMDPSEEIEVESEENEDKMESRVPDNLEELVAEYEQALKEKDEEKSARLARKIETITGMRVEEFVRQQKELFEKTKESETTERKVDEIKTGRVIERPIVTEAVMNKTTRKEDAEVVEEYIERQREEVEKKDLGSVPEVKVTKETEKVKPEIREVLLTSGVKEAEVERMVEKIEKQSEEKQVSIQKIRRETGRMLIKSGLNEVKTTEILDLVVEEVATSRLEREAEVIAKDLSAETGIEKEDLMKEVIACWKKNESLEMRMAGLKTEETEETARVVAVRTVDQRIRAMAEKNWEAVEAVRLKEVREEIIRSITTDKDGGENMEVVENYAEFVTDVYKDNPTAKQRIRVMMESPLRPGAIERGFNRTEVLVDLISRGGIEKRIKQFEGFKGLIKNFGASDKVDAGRAVNELFKWLQHDPEAVFQIEAVRNRIAWAQNWGDKIVGLFKPGGIDNLFLDVSQKIVNQPFFQFVNETSILMSGGKSFGEALGITLKSLITNGRVVAGVAAKEGATAAAGAAGAGAAGAGAAATGAATAAGSLSGASATVLSGPLAPIVGAVVAIATVATPIIKKIGKTVAGFLEQMGLTLGIKKWLKEEFGKTGGWLMGAGVAVGGMLLGIGGVLTAALAGITGFIVMIVLGPILLIAGLMLFFAGPMVSSVVPPVNLGAGVGAEYDPTAPLLTAGKIAQCINGKTSASVKSRVDTEIKQNLGEWKDKPLPGGCTFSDSGCGPTAVSKVLIKKDSKLTPDYLVYDVSGSAYNSMDCEGSSLPQAQQTLVKYLGAGAIDTTYDSSTRGCNKQDIANWICEGKIVMVLANFYINKDLKTGGHFFLAVEYKNGEIYSADPFFNDGAVLDGQAKYGHAQAIRDCLVIN